MLLINIVCPSPLLPYLNCQICSVWDGLSGFVQFLARVPSWRGNFPTCQDLWWWKSWGSCLIFSVNLRPYMGMTQYRYRDSLLSPGVSQILTVQCWGTCSKLRCTAFRWCISWGGVDLVEVGQKSIFSKSAEKNSVWGTHLYHLTLEGHNSLNFKHFLLSRCFEKFGT